MKVIVGLGNPGTEYANTRHNAGVLFLDKFSEKIFSDYGWRRQYGILIYKNPQQILVKSAEYFMNESGNILRDFAKIMPIDRENFYLVHDDLDLKLGEFKIQKAKGPKDHHGLESIERSLGSNDFWRIRVGIDNRTPNTEHRIPGDQYVLQNFSREEREVLNQVFEKIFLSL